MAGLGGVSGSTSTWASQGRVQTPNAPSPLAGGRGAWLALRLAAARQAASVSGSSSIAVADAMKALDGAAHAHDSPEAARQTTSHRIPSAPVRSAENGGS